VLGLDGGEILGKEAAGVEGMEGVIAGVGGPDDAGDGPSTTHILSQSKCLVIPPVMETHTDVIW